MSTTFNILDIIFFAFTAIFVLTATLRGFVKEIFALLNWVLALAVSYLLAPYVTDFLAAYFKSKMAIDLVSRSGLFIVVFLITAFSTANFCDSLKKKIPSSFDRSLGLLYGFAKTLIIFGAIYSLYLNTYGLLLGNKLNETTQKEPEWFEQAKCRSLIKASSEFLDPMIKAFFDSATQNFEPMLPKSEETLDGKINDMIDGKKDEQQDVVKDPLSGDFEEGYSKKEIEKLNRLMDIIGK
ncbi:MAG: CvpA family protein [Alphaproteobacteria bacterium]|nr:CvpA family protein [Alphaproteobacteria bacterium]